MTELYIVQTGLMVIQIAVLVWAWRDIRRYMDKLAADHRQLMADHSAIRLRQKQLDVIAAREVDAQVASMVRELHKLRIDVESMVVRMNLVMGSKEERHEPE
jgi:hypothetical protein